jgi:hypothetical protein
MSDSRHRLCQMCKNEAKLYSYKLFFLSIFLRHAGCDGCLVQQKPAAYCCVMTSPTTHRNEEKDIHITRLVASEPDGVAILHFEY